MKYCDDMYRGLKEAVSFGTLMGVSREGITQEARLRGRFYMQGRGGQPSIRIQKPNVGHAICVKGLVGHRVEMSCL